jgi:AraC-like DNA-binding protein
VDVAELEPSMSVLLRTAASPPSSDDGRVIAILWARAVIAIVDHFHPTSGIDHCRCRTVADSAIKRLLALDSRNGCKHVHAWFRNFCTGYATDHPLCAACSAARTVRADPARRWTIDDMAQSLAVGTVRLTNTFRAEFGLTLHEYIEVVRLCQALPLLADGVKVEAVAREVGYSSKKNFYNMFEKWVRTTPRGVRRLDRHRREALTESFTRLVFKVCMFTATETSFRHTMECGVVADDGLVSGHSPSGL